MKILGFLTGIEEIDIPFCMEDEEIYLVQHFPITQMFLVEDIIEFKIVKGFTVSNHNIVFLNCKYNKRHFTAQGYLLSKSNFKSDYDYTFEAISFSGEAIDTFFSPKRILKYEPVSENIKKMRDIYAKPFDEVSESFDLNINNKVHVLKLNIRLVQDLQPQNRSIGEVISKMRIIPDTPQHIDNIPEYYLAVLDFFRFINFRKNIKFDTIELINQDAVIYNVHVFTKKAECRYTRNKYNSIVFDDISEYFDKLFNNIVARRINGIFDDIYIPESDDDFRTVDYIKYLSCALSFEGEFARNCKPKYESNEGFAHVKDGFTKIVDEIEDMFLDESKIKKEIMIEMGKSIQVFKDEYVKTLSKRKTQQIEGYINNIKDTLAKIDFSLEEKYNFVIKLYNNIFKEIIPYLCKKSLIDEPQNKNLGKIFATMRNEIGHGSPSKIENDHVLTYQIARCMIYIIALDKSDIKHETIIKILKKLF